MIRRLRASSAVIFMTLAFAAPAVAQNVDSQVIDAILRFADALEAGDAKALKELIFVESPAQDRTRAVFIELAVTQKSLERAALRRFGEEGKRFRCGFDQIITPADRKTIQSAKIYYDDGGMRALVEKGGELSPMVLRRHESNRQWQVVLEAIIDVEPDELERVEGPPPRFFEPGVTRPEAVAIIRMTRFNAMIEAFRQTLARVESGELATAAAAQADLLTRLGSVNAEVIRARAALPRRPNN